MNNDQRSKLDDIIPAVLTAISALYMGLSSRGGKLKNVAKDSVHCLLDNASSHNPTHRNNRRARRPSRRKKTPTV
jgi:hypothetical protein